MQDFLQPRFLFQRILLAAFSSPNDTLFRFSFSHQFPRFPLRVFFSQRFSLQGFLPNNSLQGFLPPTILLAGSSSHIDSSIWGFFSERLSYPKDSPRRIILSQGFFLQDILLLMILLTGLFVQGFFLPTIMPKIFRFVSKSASITFNSISSAAGGH